MASPRIDRCGSATGQGLVADTTVPQAALRATEVR